MQKKKTLSSKRTPVEANKQENTKTQSEKKKDFSAPLSFFAVFILCIVAAMLYPYLMQEQPIEIPVKKPTNKELILESPNFIQEVNEAQEEWEGEGEGEEEQEEQEQQPTIEPADCSDQSQTILSQQNTIKELEEKIHQLELDNLNLKEQTSSSEKSILLTIRLLNEIHTGKPFEATLKEFLKHDQSDVFALTIQENLGEYSQTGIATPEKLKQLFTLEMKTAQDSFYESNTNTSWNQKWTNFFKSLVHVYPQNPTSQDTKPENLLFLARTQVNAGQFEQAIATIEKLPNSAKKFLTNFVQNAKNYIKAQKIIRTYTQERN